MKRILLSLLTISIVIGASYASVTSALFTDEETSEGNTFSAGTLDLRVNGNDDPLPILFTLNNLTPGQYHQAGTVTLRNRGTVTGRVSVMLDNPVSNDNGLIEPELDAGDEPGVEKEFGSYDVNTGDGELWDSIWLQLYIDGNGDGEYHGGAAPHNDCIIHDGAADKSSTYSFPIAQDLMPMETNYYCSSEYVDLEPGETVDVGVRTYFYSDQGGGPAGGWTSAMPPTNMAMTDNVEFDLQFGLTQVTP